MKDDEDKAIAAICEQLAKTAKQYKEDEANLAKALVRWDYYKFFPSKEEVIFSGEMLANAVRDIMKYYSTQGQETSTTHN